MAKFDPSLFEDVHGPMIEARRKYVENLLLHERKDAGKVIKSYTEGKDGVWALYIHNPETDEYIWMVDSHPAKLRLPSKPHKTLADCVEDFRLVLELFEPDWNKVLKLSDTEKLQQMDVDWKKIPALCMKG